MKLLYTEQINPNQQRVIGVHNFPYGNPELGIEPIPQEELENGILVEDFVEPLSSENKITQVYINPLTKEIWAEYLDRPLTLEEKLTEATNKILVQEKQLAATNADLAALMELVANTQGGV